MSDRTRIVLACTQCGKRNYHRTKAKHSIGGRLSLKKFCALCGLHTVHRETK